MNPAARLNMALRLLRQHPGLTAWAVARRLNMDRAAARVMLLEAESQGLLSVTLGLIDPEHGTQAKRYAPALPWLPSLLREVFSGVLAFPGLPPARLIAALGRPCTSVRRRLTKLTHLGLIVLAVISGRRAYLPAPWVLA